MQMQYIVKYKMHDAYACFCWLLEHVMKRIKFYIVHHCIYITAISILICKYCILINIDGNDINYDSLTLINYVPRINMHLDS